MMNKTSGYCVKGQSGREKGRRGMSEDVRARPGCVRFVTSVVVRMKIVLRVLEIIMVSVDLRIGM